MAPATIRGAVLGGTAVLALAAGAAFWIFRPRPEAASPKPERLRSEPREVAADGQATPRSVVADAAAAREQLDSWLQKPTNDRRTDGYNRAFEQYFKLNPEKALEALKLEQDQDLRQNLLSSTIKVATFDQLATIMASVHTLIGSAHLERVVEAGITAAVELNPAGAIEIWKRLSDNSAKSASLLDLARVWPNNDIGPLLALEKTLEFPDDRIRLKGGMESYFTGYDAAELRALLARTDLPATFTEAAQRAYGQVLANTEPVESLVAGVVGGSPIVPEVRGAALERATQKRTKEMAEAMLQGGSPDDLKRFGVNIVANLQKQSVDEAAAWVQKLPPGRVTDNLQFNMVGMWLNADPPAASRYGLEAPTERQRELAALAIQRHLSEQGDTEGASQWAARIKSPDLQECLKTGMVP